MITSKNGPKYLPAKVVVDGRMRVRQSSVYAYLASLPQGYATGKPGKAVANG
jgi:hypothetical protein